MRATIQRTVFNNYGTDGKSFGYRIYDDYGKDYCNILSEEDLKLDDEAFLKKIEEGFDEAATTIFDGAVEHGGIMIDSTWYELESDGVDGWKFTE